MTDADVARVSHLFDQLAQAAVTLNAESDSINAILGAFEARLRALNLGLEVWLNMDTGYAVAAVAITHRGTDKAGCPVADHLTLGFGKLGDKGWRLLVRTDTYRRSAPYEADAEADGDEGVVGEWMRIDRTAARPLAEAPREVRLAALKRLPPLLDALLCAARETVAIIQDAKQLVTPETMATGARASKTAEVLERLTGVSPKGMESLLEASRKHGERLVKGR